MVTQTFTKRTAVTLLTIAGVSLAVFASAQVATQNLFRRAQFIEYLRLRNQASVQRPFEANGQSLMRNTGSGLIVNFELTCEVETPLRRTWLTAETTFAFSRWLDAATIYAGLIQTDSSFCDAYFRLSQCYVARNDLSAGYNVLVLARKKFPDHPLVDLGFGQIYILLSFPRTALYYFERQLILHKEDPEGYLGASWAASALDQDEKAILYLKKGRDLLTNQIIAATGNLKPATLSNLTVRNPLGPTLDYLYIFESMLYNKLNQNEKSIEALKHLTSEDQREILQFRGYLVGMYYYNKGEKYYPKAKRNIQKASAAGIYVDRGILRRLGIRSDPEDFKAMVLRENYYYYPARTRRSNSPQQAQADSLFQNASLAKAAELYAGLLQSDSTNQQWFARLGQCYEELGKETEAVEIYRLANRRFPSDINFTLLLARELIRAGKTEESILAYRKAIDLDKKSFKAYYGACLAMAHQGEYRAALDLWISGKKYLPQHQGSGYFLEGMLHYQLGFYNVAALRLTNSWLKRDAVSKYYLSLSYHFLKNYEDLATSNMIDAINLGAIVNPETVTMVGLDPKVHRSY